MFLPSLFVNQNLSNQTYTLKDCLFRKYFDTQECFDFWLPLYRNCYLCLNHFLCIDMYNFKLSLYFSILQLWRIPFLLRIEVYWYQLQCKVLHYNKKLYVCFAGISSDY